MATDKVITGATGAYFVAFILSKMGYAVGLTTHGTKAMDIFVANPDTGKSIAIQTKTMADAYTESKKEGIHWWKWRVSVCQQPIHRHLFYVFVNLRGGSSKLPDAFIMPSTHVAEHLDEDNPGWFGIGEEDAKHHLNRWNIISTALK